MANRAKNHHIVPKVLQRQFAIDGDIKRIWRSKKKSSAVFTNPERKLLSKAFVARDYYTVTEDGKRSDRIERDYYGKIDDFLGRLIPEINKAFSENKIPEFHNQTERDIRSVILDMMKRTPDFIPEYDDVEKGQEVVEAALAALPENALPEQLEQLEAELADPTILRDQGRDIRVLGALKNSEPVLDALSEFTVKWAVSETNHSFILSSSMVYRIGNGGPNGLANPKMEMWMPLSPKIAIVLLRDPRNQFPARFVQKRDQIRKVNEYAVRISSEVGAHSEALLKSLLMA